VQPCGEPWRLLFQHLSALIDAAHETAPMALCQNITAVLDDSGMVEIEVNDVDAGSTDDVGIASSSLSATIFTCMDISEQTIDLIVLDEAGNTDSCTAIVNVVDDMAPIAIAQNITLDLNSEASISVNVDQVDNGSTDNCLIADRTLSQNTFNNPGDYPVALTVVDDSGNENTAEATITVVNSVAVIDLSFSKSLILSPNPATEMLLVEAENERIKSLHIYSEVGKLLIEQDGETVDVSSLPNGIYLIKVLAESGREGVKRFLKMKK